MLTITPTLLLAIATGGALGALARYLTHHVFGLWFGTGFPLGTLAANVSGCLLIGLFMGYWTNSGIELSNEIRGFIVIGFLGAFTTFSTFGFETMHLLREQAWGWAIANVLAQNVVGVAMAFLGFVSGRALSA